MYKIIFATLFLFLFPCDNTNGFCNCLILNKINYKRNDNNHQYKILNHETVCKAIIFRPLNCKKEVETSNTKIESSVETLKRKLSGAGQAGILAYGV